MIVGFLGAPNSGKTTIAAKVFAELKQNGQPNVEFVGEEARKYIAECVFFENKYPPLDFSDQERIFGRQFTTEQIMHTATGKSGVVVTDSSALNALWYMNEDQVLSFLCRDISLKYMNFIKENALLFYCPILGIMPNSGDNLRRHDIEESKRIDKRVTKFIADFPSIPVKAVLSGSINLRTQKVLELTYEWLTK